MLICMCIPQCTTVVHNAAQTVLIIFHLILETIIIAQMMPTGVKRNHTEMAVVLVLGLVLKKSLRTIFVSLALALNVKSLALKLKSLALAWQVKSLLTSLRNGSQSVYQASTSSLFRTAFTNSVSERIFYANWFLVFLNLISCYCSLHQSEAATIQLSRSTFHKKENTPLDSSLRNFCVASSCMSMLSLYKLCSMSSVIQP